jgi:cytochrome P450
MATLLSARPESDIDLFADAVLAEPYEMYQALRDLGGAVWMTRYEMFALPRYESLKAALKDDVTFISGEGVTLNERMNSTVKGITLCTDGEAHTVMRRVIAKPLSPANLSQLRADVEREANALVDRLIERGRFDAVTDFAQYLPITIVSNLVGLPEEGRERMLEWAQANFNCFGPMNDRTQAAFPIVKEMISYATTECVPGKLKPTGWAQMIWDAAERGEIRLDQCTTMMNDYMGPSLDTTIAAASNLIVQFANNPAQWELLCANPHLIPNAINESVRLDSPILQFGRYVAKDTKVEAVALPAGSRTLMMYACANRDERKWERPDVFDISRRDGDHLGFGFGAHQCVGSNLARLEISSLLKAMVGRVKRFEVNSKKRQLNNMLRLHANIDVTVH